jgi:hypothetical protein
MSLGQVCIMSTRIHSINNIKKGEEAKMSSRTVWSRLLQGRCQNRLGGFADHEDVNQGNLEVEGCDVRNKSKEVVGIESPRRCSWATRTYNRHSPKIEQADIRDDEEVLEHNMHSKSTCRASLRSSQAQMRSIRRGQPSTIE